MAGVPPPGGGRNKLALTEAVSPVFGKKDPVQLDSLFHIVLSSISRFRSEILFSSFSSMAIETSKWGVHYSLFPKRYTQKLLPTHILTKTNNVH